MVASTSLLNLNLIYASSNLASPHSNLLKSPCSVSFAAREVVATTNNVVIRPMSRLFTERDVSARATKCYLSGFGTHLIGTSRRLWESSSDRIMASNKLLTQLVALPKSFDKDALSATISTITVLTVSSALAYYLDEQMNSSKPDGIKYDWHAFRRTVIALNVFIALTGLFKVFASDHAYGIHHMFIAWKLATVVAASYAGWSIVRF